MTNPFKRALGIVFLMLGLLFESGCAYLSKDAYVLDMAYSEAKQANSFVDVSFSTALVLYQTAQLAEVAKVSAGKQTQEQAAANIASIRARWEKVWPIFEDIRKVQLRVKPSLDAYEKALDEGQPPDGALMVPLIAQLELLKAKLFTELAKARGDQHE